ncbi:MAG TPA: methyltransferase domain-containing protein [Patescibacteria group bacterium]|nr:methyltransferase domain-containing protein [Patescibacteria group bacterium]
MIRKKSADVLVELVVLDGKHVLDIGCGDGSLTRMMTGQGAHVTGVETSPQQLARAVAAERVADERFVEGCAQAMPAESASVDVVVFSNSLHHVPVDQQPKALAEAARVLVEGGFLYVSEPLPEGAFFQLTRLIDDETEVRGKALEALRDAARWGLEQIGETVHLHSFRHRDYATFRERMTAIDTERATVVTARDVELSEAFHRLGTPAETGGWSFDQPTRVNLFRKRPA